MKNKTNKCIHGWKVLWIALVMANTGCVNEFLPDAKDAFDRNVSFTQTTFAPVMGHTTFYTEIFNSANSTLPLTFEMTDIMHVDGTPAPELEEYYPVRVWKVPYLGTETSLAEINAKRDTEYRRLFDVRKHTGEFVMWAEANSSLLRCQPDSGYVFNLVVSNSGGYKTTKQMRLTPIREVDFEPSIYDSETGLAVAEYVNPDLSYMRYREEDNAYTNMIDEMDIHIYFRENKDDTDPNTTLTISFFDKEWKPIHPKQFNDTDWEHLFQAGFLKEMTAGYVKYDMAYPLPLFKETSNYTNTAGDRAHVRFAAGYFPRAGSVRRNTYMEIYFAIYKEAHWDMMIHFAEGTPWLGDIDD